MTTLFILIQFWTGGSAAGAPAVTGFQNMFKKPIQNLTEQQDIP